MGAVEEQEHVEFQLMLTIEAAMHASRSKLSEKLVIFNPATHLYYQLDEIAAFVWKLVSQPMTLSEICAAVETVYDVEPGACQDDVATLLQELEQVGLIEMAAQ
jgi:hypothetical protein